MESRVIQAGPENKLEKRINPWGILEEWDNMW